MQMDKTERLINHLMREFQMHELPHGEMKCKDLNNLQTTTSTSLPPNCKIRGEISFEIEKNIDESRVSTLQIVFWLRRRLNQYQRRDAALL